jgi:sensor histidine kinase YesM
MTAVPIADPLREAGSLAVEVRPAAAGPDDAASARGAFFAIFNFRTAAAVFYFCLLVAVGRFLHQLTLIGPEQWFFATVRFLRQCLISGGLIVVALALVDAVSAGRDWSRRRALLTAVIFASLAAALSVVIRYYVADSPLAMLWKRPAYPLQLWALWTTIGALAYAMLYVTRQNEATRQEMAAAECTRQTLEAQRVEAHLSALQAQIEPHFLFNTLANVKRLYETAPQRGREMLTSLIAYLRAALPSMRETGSTLARELELVHSFLTILQMRMGERLSFEIRADESLHGARVPPMAVPTLVENAVKHGLSPLPEGGHIAVVARRDGDMLEIQVRDTGAGFTASGGAGVGLANTRARLAALYGAAASLQLSASLPRGVTATVRLPLQLDAPVSPTLREVTA